MKRSLLLALALGACATDADTRLPPSRHADGSLYWPSWCQDRTALRALKVPVMPVPRNSPLLLGGELWGRYMPAGSPILAGISFIRSDLIGDAREDAEDHEACHRATEIRTGNPQFHR